MLTFLFWNTCRNDLESVVSRLAERHRVDVLMLAESSMFSGTLLQRLNAGRDADFFPASTEADKVAVYTRFSASFLQRHTTSPRYTIWRLALPARQEILLAAAHFPDKLYQSPFSAQSDCTQLARDLRLAETEVRHERTLLVGDLNMNPFEAGVVDTRGLNAVMTRELAKRKPRVVQMERYPFFYNPMWRFFGDSGDHPPGTCYYRISPFLWSIYDQVLVRPDLLRCFQSETLRILDSDGAVPFLTRRGLPDRPRVSDHLPIVFQLQL